MKYILLALLFTCTITLAQDPIGVDSLMKANRIETKVQLSCNEKGEECWPEIIWKYDQEGRLSQKMQFRKDTIIETNRYEYNSANWATKVFTTVGYGKEFLNIKFGYDAKNQLISFDACTPDGKCGPFEKYKYRQDGKLSSRTRYKDGRYFYEYRHKYDKNGNNIEVLILSNDSDSGEREVKEYDNKKQHVRSTWIDYTGEEIDNAAYTYDETGNILKNEWIGGLTTQKLYKYDSLNNNTEYTSIDYTNQIDDSRTMTYDGYLIQSRIKTDGKKIVAYWKYEYMKW